MSINNILNSITNRMDSQEFDEEIKSLFNKLRIKVEKRNEHIQKAKEIILQSNLNELEELISKIKKYDLNFQNKKYKIGIETQSYIFTILCSALIELGKELELIEAEFLIIENYKYENYKVEIKKSFMGYTYDIIKL